MQIGPGGRAGQPLTTGFLPQNRLQEGQYFELGGRFAIGDRARFETLFASGGPSFHYTRRWPSEFSVRNLYLELDEFAETPAFTLWFGSRMYRGDDVHLFDIWPLDDQNILGGGIRVHSLADQKIWVEVAAGARSEQSITPIEGTLPESHPFQRYIGIAKVGTTWGAVSLKVNAEVQTIPSSQVTVLTTDQSREITPPHSWGGMIGFQLTQSNRLGWNSLFYDSGLGDVVGGVTTVRSACDDAPAGTRTSSCTQIHRVGATGGLTLPSWGLLYALVVDTHRTPEGNASGLSASIRPIYFVTSHFHVGGELAGVAYFKELTQLGSDQTSYVQPAALIRYAFERTLFGVPLLKAVYSHAIYTERVMKYGHPRRHAFNLSTGFELWF